MLLDWGGIHLDNLLPPAISLHQLQLTRTTTPEFIEKEITDYETMHPLHPRLTYSIHGVASRAQDISGNWQGTIKAGSQEIRLIVTIDKDSVVGWKGTMFSIDQTPDRGIGIFGDIECRRCKFLPTQTSRHEL